MINEVNLQVFLLSSHSIITTLSLHKAAWTLTLICKCGFERQQEFLHQICKEPVVALLKGNHLIWGYILKFDLFMDFKNF